MTILDSSPRRRRSLATAQPFIPADLTGLPLLHALSSLASDLISRPTTPLHRGNRRSLARKIKILLSLFESLPDSQSSLDSVSFRELYILLHRAGALLDHCTTSSRLHLLLDPAIPTLFRDLTNDLSTLLDILPLDPTLPADVREGVALLRRQCRRSDVLLDPRDDRLRRRVLSFLTNFEAGIAPAAADLRAAFVDGLGLSDAAAFRAEIDFHAHDDSVGALARYSMFALFGCRERTPEPLKRRDGNGEVAVPKDFCCPISLELMKDPVVAATGQTYDRASITRWMDEGHTTCPNSGQALAHTALVPNLALRGIISQWCADRGVQYEPPERVEVESSKAAMGANRATAEILVRELGTGSEEGKTVAARELRMLAKTGKENRACVAEAGAIPFLCTLLSSSNPEAQENAVTAFLNLSILGENKRRIVEGEGCLRSIVDVLLRGWMTEARENAAATLCSLSVVHDYKKRIAEEAGAVEGLVGLLRDGTPRGQKDAVAALFNLSSHQDCSDRMVESDAVSALVNALATEVAAEEAAAALALLVRYPAAAEAVVNEEGAVISLVGLMRMGSPRGKEHAVAALHELCRAGGVALTKRVARTSPALGGLIQKILLSGTKRARRKAAALARMCQRCAKSEAETVALGGGWDIGYALASSSSARRTTDVQATTAVSVL